SAPLRHPNILALYGLCVRPPQMCSVCELCERGSLIAAISDGIWPAARKLSAAIDACAGVAYLHAMGVWHRDVKMDNFLVTRSGSVKLCDFGESISRPTALSIAQKTPLAIVGTVAYMAPELVAADRGYTEAVDVYALAIVLRCIWCREAEPWPAAAMTFDIFAAVAAGRRPHLPDDCPPAYAAVVRRAWEASADARP
ncbi:kinase-like domain-containing protein, partial [Pelagophyceae sp. CCMP2097]